MMTEEKSVFVKKILTTREYGELSTDCSWKSFYAGAVPFFIGAIGVPGALKYLDRFLFTSHEFKALGGVIGAFGFSIYACVAAKDKCERKITSEYTLPWLEKIRK